MGLPINFQRNINYLRSIIISQHLHDEYDQPVDIDCLLGSLSIDIEETCFEDARLNGYSIQPDLENINPKMFISVEKSIGAQRVTKAHEVTHMLIHYKELPLCSHLGNLNKTIEREANYGAAYLLIPTKAIHFALKYKVSFREVAEQLGVTLDAVFLRSEIYWQLEEYANF